MIRRILGALVAVALSAAAPVSAPGEEAAGAAWKLGPSDMARYEKRKVTVKNGAESLGGPSIATLHGNDLRDDGLYLSVTPSRDDFAAMFAFRTPPAGPFEWRVHLDDAAELRIKGAATAASASADALEIVVEAAFASSGKPGPYDKFALKDGRVRSRISFDRGAGVVSKARVELSYAREKLDAKKGEKPAAVDETWEFAFASVSASGNARFGADVNAAIDRGLAHLLTLQKDDGSFDPYSGQEMGTTALCVYTLSSCGVPVEDPKLEKALQLLCGADPKRTYEQAVALMAVERAYTPPDELAMQRPGEERRIVRDLPPDRRAWCERTAAALEVNCSAPGTWGYPNAGNDLNRADTSNTQYAVLGLQAASRLGIAVKESTWLGVLRWFGQVREGDGPRGTVSILRAGQAITETAAALTVPEVAGFRYRPNERRVWGSMTCAGIASLSIVRDELKAMKGARLTPKIDDEIDDAILGGWAWLDRHWSTSEHPEKPGRDWYYYYLYSLERAGILSGVQRVGGRDWYFEGASELVARQRDDGSWDESGGNHTTETCFALLFLRRATAPLTPR